MKREIDIIKEIICGATELYTSTDITEYTPLEELNLDEIDLLEICCQIEERFDIEFSDTTVELSMNARDFLAIVYRMQELA